MTASFSFAGLTEGQEKIVRTLDRRVFVAAGAGSGKTFTLTKRVVWALTPGSGEGGAPYLDNLGQALVITFTEKAASEIRDRVRSALHAAGLVDDALRIDEAWIGTIHGMCSRILHRHALDLGLDPQFSVIAEHDAQRLRASALEAVIAEMQDEDPAGLRLLREAYPPTDTGASASDFRSMASLLMDKAATTPGGYSALRFAHGSLSTVNLMEGLLSSFERLCGCRIKDEAEFEACCATRDELAAFCALVPGRRTAEAALALFDSGRLHKPNGQKWRAKAVKEAYDEARSGFELVQATLALAGARSLEEPLMALARRASTHYDAAKREVGGLDNDDLLRLTYEAFEARPDIAERYEHKFRLVMIDEFQDTSAQQVEMTRRLSGPGVCHLCTVGDAQQSIYRFRGADVDVFRRYQRESGDDAVRLNRNFRSHDDVLRFVAKVCGEGGLVADFMDLECDPSRDKSPEFGGGPRVYLEFVRGMKSGERGSRAPGADVRRRVMAAQIADRLAALHANGVPLSDMALLLGATAYTDIYLEALRERGIESVVAGGSTFSKAPEVAAVAALLHTLANPRDTQTGLFPLLSSGMFELDANDFCLLATKEQLSGAPAKRRIYPGIAEELFGGIEGSARMTHARAVLGRAWARMGQLPVADVCLMAIRESGWLERLEHGGAQGQATEANLLAAVRYVRDLTEQAGFGPARAVREFDAWLAAAKVGPASLSGGGVDAVSVMTVHKSKGLEFGVVAVAECYGSQRSVSAPKLLAWDGPDGVTLSLASPSYSFDAKLLGDDVPCGPEDCVTPLEWRVWLEANNREAATQELGRLVYVALTRAREAIVLGAQGEPKKDGCLSAQSSGVLTQAVVASVIDASAPAGEHAFAYGGSAAGLARVTELRRDGDVVVGEAAGAFDESLLAAAIASTGASSAADSEAVVATAAAGADGRVPTDAAADRAVIPSRSDNAYTSGDMSEVGDQVPDGGAFLVPELEPEARGLSSWRPREGVFSYSSAHAALAQGLVEAHGGGVATLDDILDLPVPLPATSQDLPALALVPGEPPEDGPDGASRRGRRGREGDKPAALATAVPVVAAEGDDGEPTTETDEDRATNIGTAFHELARLMVETGRPPSSERVSTVAAGYGVSRRDVGRLSAALARWEASELRHEVLTHRFVRAEVPFFCEVESPLGHDLEGAIDLLAANDLPLVSDSCSEGRPSALLVDYKTGDRGLAPAQIRANHEMQARFYAYVLRRMGYGSVDCAFVCVELEDGLDQPFVTRYRFR